MEKKCGIFVVKRLHFSNFLDFIWTWTLHLKILLDCGWTCTEFLKIRTGSGSQNMTVRSSLVRRLLLGYTMNQSSFYIYCRAALSLRGTVRESSRHGVWESLH